MTGKCDGAAGEMGLGGAIRLPRRASWKVRFGNQPSPKSSASSPHQAPRRVSSSPVHSDFGWRRRDWAGSSGPIRFLGVCKSPAALDGGVSACVEEKCGVAGVGPGAGRLRLARERRLPAWARG